jgi:hypothetical protein
MPSPTLLFFFGYTRKRWRSITLGVVVIGQTAYHSSPVLDFYPCDPIILGFGVVENPNETNGLFRLDLLSGVGIAFLAGHQRG